MKVKKEKFETCVFSSLETKLFGISNADLTKLYDEIIQHEDNEIMRILNYLGKYYYICY